MILYLHGFRSSPSSAKAVMLGRALGERGYGGKWHCPQLPAGPAQAMALCDALIDQHHDDGKNEPLILMGSSLGGYYATCLAEKRQCRAVVLNPVVHAARDLATQVGEHTQYHSDEPFVFLPEHVDELARMAVGRPADPKRYFLLAATGDEVLDWREMAQWYAGSHGRIIQGSDHGISDFGQWMPEVLRFVLAP
ncbi:YqiA/YcfP family alpha/beta fold hydrolase [Pusillimonas sp.]|uniref:YqiA/YcfP family alpha/beta fold hydrolase n=1 Tax=Pusillimonas sp. TaxID=3040095 RepID=UPI0029B3D869|nr:YqiA/YcfP family alpha/beta fold hydrolase [Pusillimonas sp.]MDX3893784.1 YqiA/YcfP family alpha/beta fold hydrolase [Pusillimonas sp.]